MAELVTRVIFNTRGSQIDSDFPVPGAEELQNDIIMGVKPHLLYLSTHPG